MGGACRGLARLRDGEEMTPDQIKIAVSPDLEQITEQHKAKVFQVLSNSFWNYHPDEYIQKKVEEAVQAKLAEMSEPKAPSIIEQSPETISQAAAAWFEQMQNDPSAAVRQTAGR
jgi:hypothetical protein